MNTLEVDDDGKLHRKWSLRKSNAKAKKLKFRLTLEDIARMLKKDGLQSSDWSREGGYDLARFGDRGGYEIGNCRFISHQDNLLERRLDPLYKIPDRVIAQVRKLRAVCVPWKEVAKRTGYSKSAMLRRL